MVEKIVFSKKLFNPLYFHIQHYLEDENIRRIMIYGSSSSSKTYSISKALVIDGGVDKKYNSIFFRKEGANIKDTVKNTLLDIIDEILSEHPLDTLFQRYEFEFRTIFDNVLKMRGLDTSGKIKGLEGYKKVYLDELDQFSIDDWKEMNRRLRGDTNQQIIASWNPVSERHWIKTQFIDKLTWSDLPKTVNNNPFSTLSDNSFVKISEDKRTVLIKTVYHDNKWVVGGQIGEIVYGRVDKQVLADFEEMSVMYPYDYMVYGLGEWGVIRPETPYFHNYSDEIHYSKDNHFDFDPMAETWLSFDFNYNPTTCTVLQIMQYGVLGMRTYGTKGGTRELCKLMKKDVELMSVPTMMWTITGDSSGNNKSSTAGDVTDYDIIREELEIGDQFVRVNSRNKAHTYSRRLCDTFLYKIPFTMDARCAPLRDDFLKSKPIDGTEQLYKNREKGYGMDYIDNFRYFVDAKFFDGIDSINRFSELCKLNKAW